MLEQTLTVLPDNSGITEGVLLVLDAMLIGILWEDELEVILELDESLQRQDAKLAASEVKLAANTPEITETPLLEIHAGE